MISRVVGAVRNFAAGLRDLVRVLYKTPHGC